MHQPDDDWGDDQPPSLWQEFGLPEPATEDERQAPPIDDAVRRQLLALFHNSLPEEQAAGLRSLLLRFRSYREEMARIASQGGRATPGPP